MFKRILTFSIVGIFLYVNFVHAEMSSTNYKIRWDSFSTGGSDTSSSASYIVRDSITATATGSGSSSSYQLQDGYASAIDDQIISFSLKIQDVSDERTATALASTTVTTDTTGVSVDDYILIVQDKGASQVSAIGKVSSIGAGTLTVDSLTTSGSTPTIDGTNDYVYQLDGSAITYPTLSDSYVRTAVIGFEVSSRVDNGYVVQVLEDGNMRNDSDDIDDVSDGTVTAGSEEYGARSSDSSLSNSTFDTEDAAITTSFKEVASTTSMSYESRNFITLKAAIATETQAGSYSHIISLIASGNY